MLHRPDCSDEDIERRLAASYGLPVARIVFLPIGFAENAIFRIETTGGETYLLKLCAPPLKPAAWLVPTYLRSSGIDLVMEPVTAEAGMPVEGQGFIWLLYPFLEGSNGFQKPLSASQWVLLGRSLSRIHAATLPQHVLSSVRSEDYSEHSLNAVMDFDKAIEGLEAPNPEVGAFWDFWKEERQEIRSIVQRTRLLGQMMQGMRKEFVLCHGDLHAGNIQVGVNGDIAIIDWDDPVMAPRERDLMFIGGGVGGSWNTTEEVASFYEGYSLGRPDPVALAYYRYQRIAADLAVYSDRIASNRGSVADNERDLQRVMSAFGPNEVIEIAHRTWIEAGLEKPHG